MKSRLLTFCLLLIFFSSTVCNAQVMDFVLEAQTTGNRTAGDYIEYTYVITNLTANETITNITVDHTDLSTNPIQITPSSLAPGQTISIPAPDRLPIVYSMTTHTGFASQATVSGEINGTVHTELSDGIDWNGALVPDGQTFSVIDHPHNYGMYYIDENDNGNYDETIDTPAPNVEVRVVNSSGTVEFIRTNEAGWINFDHLMIPDNIGFINFQTLPASNDGYQIVEGQSPYNVDNFFAMSIRTDVGFKRGPAATMKVSSFVDNNANGIKDTGETFIPQTTYARTINNDPQTREEKNPFFGDAVYFQDTNPGVNLNDIDTALPAGLDNHYTISPVTYDDYLTTAGTEHDIAFAITENDPTYRDAAITMGGRSQLRVGDENLVILKLDNYFNGTATGQLDFTFDMGTVLRMYVDDVDVVATGNATVSQGLLTYTYSVDPFRSEQIYIVLDVPSSQNSGSNFNLYASITPTSTDIDASNNTATTSGLTRVVTTTDVVEEVHGPVINLDDFSAGDRLYYSVELYINFAGAVVLPAEFVIPLNEKLDASTFRIEGSNKQIESYSLQGQLVNLHMNHANSTLQGNGLLSAIINFSVEPFPGLVAGDFIEQQVAINLSGDPTAYTNVWRTDFINFPDIVEGSAVVYDIQGRRIITGEISNGTLDGLDMPSGLYLISINSNSVQSTVKVVKR